MENLRWSLEVGEEQDPATKPLKISKEYSFSNVTSSSSSSSASSGGLVRKLARSPRVIPRGKSSAERAPSYSSAPADVPDWLKEHQNDDANESDDRDDEEEMIPPHEYIAKRLARANISSFSMCEGNGRTLKGRDLRKVRNDILTKTGFLE